ncbi:MAG: nicotinate (nicotinamide) nucleotide adenylyltransferase [Oscillospiraceae bacterium]|nr:nicotinate (nicotinamide) nucleotide adenylyltransferase [Oscillospiraceae bacterium]
MSGRRVGLFGGSFNPPHLGHVSAARRAGEALALDTLVLMPAGTPPHKPLPQGTPSPADRLALAKLAFASLPNACVSDRELAATGPNYTVDTLDWLRETYPQAALTLVMGTDMFLTLHEWRRAEDILGTAGIAVLARAEGQDATLKAQAAFLAHRFGASIALIPHTPVDVSSTTLRALLRTGGGRAYLSEPVCDYIRARGLYGVSEGGGLRTDENAGDGPC